MNIDVPLTDYRSAPIIETDRLLLRTHRLSDIDDCVSMWADPEIARFTIGEPSPPARTWSRLLAYIGHWTLAGFGYWAIEEKESGRYLGEMGFADFKRGLYPALEKMPEAGWVLASFAQGQGFSTEGLRAIIAWSERHFDQLSTACLIKNDNSKSLRIAQKLGYVATPQIPSADAAETTVFIRAPTTRKFVKLGGFGESH